MMARVRYAHITNRGYRELSMSTYQPKMAVPERIYNSHYGNGMPAMFTS
jgi:hypothetical protein